MMLTKEAKELLLRYGSDDCTPEEKQFIEEWFRKQRESGNLSLDGKNDKQIIRELMESGLQGNTSILVKRSSAGSKRKRWVISAVLILVLAFAYLIFIQQPVNKINESVIVSNSNDVNAPQLNRSLLTLADGNIISLDSTGGNEIARQGNLKIIKTAEGAIQYLPALAGPDSSNGYNMLYNPRGSQVAKLTLSDGSRVWLNSESSLRYPVDFAGTERKVELTGEAYFEVAKAPSKRFIVSGTDLNVEVMGTRFHVNNYQDEVTKNVTVMEGALRVIPNFGKQNARVLKQGEQAQINFGVLLRVVADFNLEKTMAWKNEEFVFEKNDLRVIMLQLAIWYDIQPIFKTTDHTQYTARISRNVPLSAVLAMLEKNGSVKFEIEGKDVFINAAKSTEPAPPDGN